MAIGDLPKLDLWWFFQRQTIFVPRLASDYALTNG